MQNGWDRFIVFRLICRFDSARYESGWEEENYACDITYEFRIRIWHLGIICLILTRWNQSQLLCNWRGWFNFNWWSQNTSNYFWSSWKTKKISKSCRIIIGTIKSKRIKQRCIDPEGDYEVDEKQRSCILTDQGFAKCEEYLYKNLYNPQDPWAHYITNALKAKGIY